MLDTEAQIYVTSEGYGSRTIPIPLLTSVQYPAPVYLNTETMASGRSRQQRTRSANAVYEDRDISGQTIDTPPKTSGKKSSAYDPNFEQLLIDNGAFPDEYDYPNHEDPGLPENWDEINTYTKIERRSLSPSLFSPEDFQKFRRTNARALGEKKVASSIVPIIRGNAEIPYEEDRPFVNLEPFADGLVVAQPDFYDGSQPARVNRRIRTELGPYIVPSAQDHAPILPNFLLEVKGADGSPAVAKRQASHNGVLGARAMHLIQSYRNGRLYDNKAYTITSTYQDGQLKMYTMHPTHSNSSQRDTDYHMILLGGWSLIGSERSFREGVGAFRNLRDWAKEQREHFIQNANSKLTNETDLSQSAAARIERSYVTPASESRDSDTSADELTSAPVTTSQSHNRQLKRRHLKSKRRRRSSESRSKSRRRSRSDHSSQRG